MKPSRVPTRRPDVRRLWPFLLGAVLLLLGATVVSRIPGQRADLYNQTHKQMERELTDRVEAWEDTVLAQMDAWTTAAKQDPSQSHALQDTFRAEKPWFDSLYMWVPRKDVRVQGRVVSMDPYLIYPRPPAVEDTRALLAHPCLLQARLLTVDPEVSARAVARALLTWCGTEDLPVRLVAASEAASILNAADLHGEALATLSVDGLPADLSLTAAVDEGVTPYRMVIHRNQVAGTMAHLGRTDEAMALYYESGLAITALDGPEAQQELVQAVQWPILAELKKHGFEDEARQIKRRMGQLKRRVQGFKEIGERVMTVETRQAPTGHEVIYDQYSDPPFVLFYELFPAEAMGVALQLDQPLLLADFLGAMRRTGRDLVIQDAQGNWVGGLGTADALDVEVPFTRTLTHLRAGFTQKAVAARVASADEQWIVPLILAILCVILGFLAITALLRASRQQHDVLVRQREFTTRVTHELKTPLAGIRVMAENLENGAWRDEEQIHEMAHSIIQEADRLTQRVDEILTAGRQPEIADPQPFDPEAVLLESIEAWGPRLERVGIKLEADLGVTDEVVGDEEAVRDAVGCLLDNALKYRDTAKANPSVWLSLRQEGSEIVIEVVDNGLGVPNEMREQIFERFVRVEGPNRGKAGGHGLGLYQVATTVALHGGAVRCEDGVDGGARFVLRLPGRST